MKKDDLKDDLMSYNSKMVGNEVLVVRGKNLSNWKGRVEKVIDEEYFHFY